MSEKVEKKTNTVKNTIKKTSKTEENKKIKNLEEKNKNLQNSVKSLQEQITSLMSLVGNINNINNKKEMSRYDDIKIVHLYENDPSLRTHIQLSNLTIDLVTFGEERTLTVQQFEELIGKYRHWFNKGILAVGSGYEEYAKKNNLKTVKDYPIDSTFVKKLGTLTLTELEDIYMKLGEGHRSFIISYFKIKIIQKDANFLNIHKIELLNRLSSGAFKYEIQELTNIK